MLLHGAFHGESRTGTRWRDNGLVLLHLLGTHMWSLVVGPVHVVMSPSPIRILKRMVPEIVVPHDSSSHRAARQTTSSLEMIHSKSAAVVKARHDFYNT